MDLAARMAVAERQIADLDKETAKTRVRLHKLENDQAAAHAARAALSAARAETRATASSARAGRAERLTVVNAVIAIVAVLATALAHHL